MHNCCICKEPVGNSEAVLMINAQALPICETCDNYLAMLYEGSPDEIEDASKRITSRCISADAHPAIKAEVAKIIKQARLENSEWISGDYNMPENDAEIGTCASCNKVITASDYYMELKEHQLLCDDCAQKAGLSLKQNKKLSLWEYEERNIQYQNLQLILQQDDLQKYCGNRLIISKRQGKFAVGAGDSSYLRFQIGNLNDIIDIKYFDDVQTAQIQTRRESSGAGSAVLGAILFGGVGMVAGGMMGRKSALYENVTFLRNCGFIVTYRNGEMAKFNLLKLIYDQDSISPNNEIFQQAQSLTSAICKELAPYTIQDGTKAIETSAESDIATQLTKMAELVKEGFVTREEFDAFKKKLLGTL